MNIESRETFALESEKIIPSLNLRPHHFWDLKVSRALLGRTNPHALAQENGQYFRERALETQDPSGYYSDVVGNSQTDIETYQNKLETYLIQLSDLPDDSYIHIDLKPDGICGSCVIGKHCKSTNYTSDMPPGNVVAIETKRLMGIRQRLERSGYKLGEDFLVQQTTHTLYDLGGQTLKDSAEGTPKDIVFNSIIVKTEALRKILLNPF